MRKALSFVTLGVVATFAMWMLNARVPFRIIDGRTVVPTAVPGLPPDKVFVIVLVAVLGSAIAALAYARHREGVRQGSERADHLNANVEDRLERIEQTLEAVALEVERIGEMERFATKLLAARERDAAGLSPIPPSSPPRVITPH